MAQTCGFNANFIVNRVFCIMKAHSESLTYLNNCNKNHCNGYISHILRKIIFDFWSTSFTVYRITQALGQSTLNVKP